MFKNWWMNNENEAHMHNGIVYDHKKDSKFAEKWIELESITLNRVA